MPGEDVRASNVHGGECSMGMCSSWVHCTQCWVSLIAGGGYRWKMGWNDGCS